MNRIGPIQLFAEIKRHENRATYRGYDTESGQVVLVKIFTPASLPDEAALAHFHQEAAIYASLNHPNVVQLVKFGAAESRPYLALEFIEGQNLRNLLAQRSPLPSDIAIGLLLALLGGLAEIHRHEIIHRDLKPENIMIGNDGRVKICDFDLAISRSETALAASKNFSGSSGYFSPEAILGDAITPRSDLFALGIVLYEMFTGTRPFAAATTSGEMNAVVRLPHLAPSKLNPAMPPEIEPLINRLLAKSPDQRPPRAMEVVKSLASSKALVQIFSPAQQAQRLCRYLNDSQNYQSDGFVLPTTMPPTTWRKKIPWRIVATAAFIVLAIMALTYQKFVREATTSIDRSVENSNSLPQKDSPAISPHNSSSTLEDVQKRSVLFSKNPTAKSKIEKTSLADSPAVRAAGAPPLVRDLVVRNVPWAYLFVNDDSIGQMPRPEPLSLRSGIYRFVFKKPQFPPIFYKVVVDSATADTLFFSLWERVAQVEIKIHPWAEIYLNGGQREISTAAPTFYLLPGAHHFKFVHPQYGEKNETIFLRAGEVRRLEVNMFQPATKN